jgi:dethiobiotin synthetase
VLPAATSPADPPIVAPSGRRAYGSLSARPREGKAIDFAALVAHGRRAVSAHKDALIIEGIDGVTVPLDDRHSMLDWMIELDLPLILVAGSYVGTLSHTLTALDVLDRASLKAAAVVVNETPGSAATLEETATAIRRFAAGIEVLILPRLPEGTHKHPVMASLADLIDVGRCGKVPA